MSQSNGVQKIPENHKSKDNFFEYMFIDAGLIVGIYGDKPPLVKTKSSVKIEVAIVIYGRLLSQVWVKTNPC